MLSAPAQDQPSASELAAGQQDAVCDALRAALADWAAGEEALRASVSAYAHRARLEGLAADRMIVRLYMWVREQTLRRVPADTRVWLWEQVFTWAFAEYQRAD
jgi:hypothetical protein